MSAKAPNSNFSSEQETKNFVTPFAFRVNESLIGMRLASPKRRLASIFVDMICVGLLTTLSGFWFSALVLLVAAWTLFRLKGEEGKAWARFALRVALIISFLAIAIQATVHFFLSDEQSEQLFSKLATVDVEIGEPDKILEFRSSGVDSEYSLVVSDLKSPAGDTLCAASFKCDARFFDGLLGDLVAKGYAYQDASVVYQGLRDFLAKNDRLDAAMQTTTLSERLYQNRVSGQHSFAAAEAKPSLISWVSGFLGDLGLSFGWAALYFSVLTSSWNGQTVGKRLLGIKVVRIDGKAIDLWESFGRYGGYSAGFATGLMGFIQIYWDANRQAIQDKISETLVVRL